MEEEEEEEVDGAARARDRSNRLSSAAWERVEEEGRGEADGGAIDVFITTLNCSSFAVVVVVAAAAVIFLLLYPGPGPASSGCCCLRLSQMWGESRRGYLS